MDTRAAATASAEESSGKWDAVLAFYAEGRFAEALDLLSSETGSAESCVLRAELQWSLGRIHEASKSYAAAVAQDRGNAFAHRRLADCLRILQRWDDARESYDKALELDSDCQDARLGLGDCLLHLNRPEDALACFESCRPESAFVAEWFGRAVALHMLGRWEEAIALYERVLDVQPQCEEALTNLIALSVERFDLRRVEHYALELLRQDSDSLIALQALTIVSYERRNYEKASDYYFEWEGNLPEGGLPAQKDAIQYRLSRESVEHLAELRLKSWSTD